MNISLHPTIAEKIPEFKIGLIHYNKIVVEQSPQMIKGRMQLYQESLYFDFLDSAVTERGGIAEWRTIWKTFGADPNRYRHSAESLMRRIAKQNYLTPFHSAVDLNNFFSILYECPVGIYDVENISGDVEIAIGDVETSYEGLNGRVIRLENIIHSRDSLGAFGSPYVDSVRSAVSEQTTSVLQIFYLRPSLTLEQSEKLLQASADMFTQVHGGDAKIALVHKDELSASL